jgi:hypothetical protein
MDIPLQSYQPVNQDYELVWMALGIFIIGAIGSVWLFRQKPAAGRNAYTGLIGMLIGFIAIISLGTGIFGWLAIAKNRTLHIYADRIEFGKRRIPFQNLENAVIEESKETSWINPNITKKSVQLLFLADNQGKTYVLSAENYPVKEIMAKLKAAVAQWEGTSH